MNLKEMKTIELNRYPEFEENTPVYAIRELQAARNRAITIATYSMLQYQTIKQLPKDTMSYYRDESLEQDLQELMELSKSVSETLSTKLEIANRKMGAY
ncbi:hypothetical protein FC72_GL000506 [Companilactobacillus tucceti DSM 20183]|uniref:Uncharacterized protein n=1 Tax=Companilactobacillus tucceti DSM 20183 TaxID=1423811 RepID=A0A0R1J9J4_9LACO|nr:hypothetical protein [Companilactobacillus tucceti]KRK64338.1 hypothetical protein FC72_GL000506 [Companilactobacillus tucceti DSM 20183]